MTLSKNDTLRSEIDMLKFRLKTSRDKEILLLTQLIDMRQQLDYVLATLKEKYSGTDIQRT